MIDFLYFLVSNLFKFIYFLILSLFKRKKEYVQNIRDNKLVNDALTSGIPINISLENIPPDKAHKAIEIWNKAIGGTKLLKLAPGRGAIHIIKDKTALKSNLIGLHNNGVISIRPWFERNVTLLAHELGHAIGFPHNDDHRSIMYPTILPFQKITTEIKAAILTKFKPLMKN